MSRLNMRIDEELKEAASQLYQSLGMDLTTAVTIFLKQSVREGGLPFRPNLGAQAVVTTEMEQVPVPIKAEYYAGILKVRFANQVVRYLKITLVESPEIQLNPLNNLPKEIPIDDKGNILLGEDHVISPEEAWKEGKLSININLGPLF